MPRRLAAMFLLAASLAASPAAADERAFEAALGDFRQLHRAEMRRSGIVGSSFYFVRDGRTVAADHLGEQDADAHVPVDARTIYHWASITKTMTGIAIMQLRDRGLLTLDDPIVRYVPELARVHNPFGDTGAITLRQLMSHSAGFRGGTWPWRDQEWQPFEPPGWAQLEAMLPYTRGPVPPRLALQLFQSRHRLSGAGDRAAHRRGFRGLCRQEHPAAARHARQLFRPHAAASAAAPLAQLLYPRRPAGRGAVRRRYRRDRVERRPQRADDRHGEICRLPDRRSGAAGGL